MATVGEAGKCGRVWRVVADNDGREHQIKCTFVREKRQLGRG